MATELPEDKIFICIHHFREEDIIRADRTVQADGFLGQPLGKKIVLEFKFNVDQLFFKADRLI